MNLAHERHILRLHDDIKRLQGLVQVGGHGCFQKAILYLVDCFHLSGWVIVRGLPRCIACQPLCLAGC